MSALQDLLQGTPTGEFSVLFCNTLLVVNAFITNLFAKQIILNSGGEIQSENYTAGSAGFKIGYDGNAEFNNGTFRGLIEADEGYFQGNVNAKSLDAGLLSVSLATPQSQTKNFGADTTAKDIYYSIRAIGKYAATGNYGNQTITDIELSYGISGGQDYPYVSYTESTDHSIKLGAALSVTLIVTGKTLKMFDLPQLPAASTTEVGTIFKVVLPGTGLSTLSLSTSSKPSRPLIWGSITHRQFPFKHT